MTQKTQKVYFKELDGLRFIAFFAVFLSHCFFSENPAVTASPVYALIRKYAHLGIFGVNFFFVLSGFLITYLLFAEKVFSGTLRLGLFYLRRVLRIWPLYFLILLVGFILVPFIQVQLGNLEYQETAPLWPYLLFINNFFESPETAILGVLWSIAVEEQFYLVWPILIKYLRPRKIFYLMVVVIISSALLRTFIIGWGYQHSLSCMSDLAVGALLAWACHHYLERRDRLAQRLKRGHIILVYCLGLLLILYRDTLTNSEVYYLNERLVYSVFFAFIIFVNGFSITSKINPANLKGIVRLGTVSYGLYMFHRGAIYLVSKVMEGLNLGDQLWHVLVLAPMLSLLLSIALALGSYHVLERPFLRWKKKLSVIVRG